MMGSAFFPFRGFVKKISKLNLKGKKLICFATGSVKKGWERTCNYIKKKLSNLEHLGNFGCKKRNNKQALEEFENLIKNFL